MVGKLELLCGPSGVGKTSSQDSEDDKSAFVMSYRCTTRDPRDDELIDLEGVVHTYDEAVAIREKKGQFISRKGIFVTADTFTELWAGWHLAGVHGYPEPDSGNWYGFLIGNMLAAAQDGYNLSEQIVAYDPIAEIADCFKSQGVPVEKVLFLTSVGELYKRSKFRGATKEDIAARLEVSKKELRKYLENMEQFDRIRFVFPKTIRGEDSNKKVEEIIATLKQGELPDEFYDFIDGSASFELACGNKKEDQIRRLIWLFEESRGQGLPLVLTHAKHLPAVNKDFCALMAMQSSESDSATGTYITALGVSIIMNELGQVRESKEQLNLLERAIFDVAETGKVNRHDFLSRVGREFFIRYLNTHSSYEEIEDFTGKYNAFLSFRSACHELYCSIKQLSTYLFKERQGYRSRQDEQLSVDDAARITLFQLTLEDQMLCLIDRLLGGSDVPHLVKRRKYIEHRHGVLNRTMNADFNQLPAEVQSDLLSMQELDFVSSIACNASTSAHIVSDFLETCLKRYYSQTANGFLFQRDDSFPGLVEQYLLPAITPLQTGLCRVPEHPCTVYALANVNEYVQALKESCIRMSRGKVQLHNIIFPEPDWPQTLLQKYWIQEVPSLPEMIDKLNQSTKELCAAAGIKYESKHIIRRKVMRQHSACPDCW